MPVPFGFVRITDPFICAWQRSLAEDGLPHQWLQCEETSRLENFRRVARGESGGFEGIYYNDSDVHKIAEAACYAAALFPESAARQVLDEWIDLTRSAQSSDGYLVTYIQLDHPEKRYLSLATKHEMYILGHLLEACSAWGEAFGDGEPVRIGDRVADHLASTFGPGKRHGYCGHQEVEIGLARFGKLREERSYVDLAKYMTDARGCRPSPLEQELSDEAAMAFVGRPAWLLNGDGSYSGQYFQDDVPLREQRQAVGHSVRAMYQFCGALDCYGGSDEKLLDALQAIWSNMVDRRMYVTGGIGSSGRNEGFTQDYDLPNASAYAETCAAIGLCMWASRMAEATGEARYGEVFERALFNGVLAGVSLDGKEYHYDNPLESFGKHRRKPWFDCACCPPNVARFLLSLSRYTASLRRDELTLLLPIDQEIEWTINGSSVKVVVNGGYPWRGNLSVSVECERPTEFALRVRQPEWVRDSEFRLSDGFLPDGKGHWVCRQVWNSETFEIGLKIPVETVVSDPRVVENRGRIAVQRGPVIYCCEEVDLGDAVQALAVDGGSFQEGVGDGDRLPMTIQVDGWVDRRGQSDSLYVAGRPNWVRRKAIPLVPYYYWNNRAAGSMQVWLRDSATRME
ncbi:glycoside hydrolase family 127 protein [Kamptonema cortianum]|nr:glycoside hydrolase family 127 protein [Kamptonema cortianum]